MILIIWINAAYIPKMHQFLKRSIASLLMMLAHQVQAADDFDRQEIERRIKPIGQVRVEKSIKTNAAAATTQAPAVKKRPGQEIYEKYCVVCHRDGVAGAPKFRSADWQARLAEKKTLDVLADVVLQGLNAMPPKGTCQECTKDDLKNAIHYMISDHD